MPTSPPGTEDSAFLSFAILDELIRTLTKSGQLTREETADIFRRIIGKMEGLKRPQAERCLPIAKAMLKEYSE